MRYRRMSNINFEKSIVTLKAFLPDDNEIESIIRFCDLLPITNWKFWGNGHSPSIKVAKTKNLICRYRQKVIAPITEDLYGFADTRTIADISNVCLFINDPDDSDIFLFLGRDDKKLRLSRFLVKTEEWKRDFPLTLPLDDIRTIIRNQDVDAPKNVDCYGSLNATAYITPWPCKQLLKTLGEDEIKCTNQALSLIEDCSDM